MTSGLKHARVIAAYTCAYSDPLTLENGEPVTVGRNDTRWPGFVWCTNRAGRGGWVPESYLERQGSSGKARKDYTAKELTVGEGEILTIQDEESGWAWCVNPLGERGWVPLDHIENL